MKDRLAGCAVALIGIALGATAWSWAGQMALEIPLGGSRIWLTDAARPTGRRNLVGFVDRNVSAREIDPRVSGATAFIGRVGDGVVTVLDLPSGGWGLAGQTGRKDYRFRSQDGPVLRARLVDGRSLRLSAHGPGAYALEGTPQQAVGVIVQIGGVRFCGLFGGTITRDDGTVFLARKASAPSACPVLGSTTTSTTTSTTLLESTTSTTESTTTTTTTTSATESTTTSTSTSTTESTTTTTSTTTSTTESTTTTTASTTTTTTMAVCGDDFDCDDAHVCRGGLCVPCLVGAAYADPCDPNGVPCCGGALCINTVDFCAGGAEYCCID